jgi:hypothetical protein
MHPDPNVLRKIGGPGMVGVGPGENLRKKKFDLLKQDVKKMHDQLKKAPTLSKASIEQCLTHMGNLKKDVDLYCKDHAGAKPFQDDYTHTMEGLKKVKDKWGDQKKVTAEMLKIGTQLTRMVNANYVA